MPQPKVGANIRFVERRNHPQVLDGLVYNGTPGAGFGDRFDRIPNVDPAFAKAA